MKPFSLLLLIASIFSFSSCEKCLECTKSTVECGFCSFGTNGNTQTECSDNANNAYQNLQIACQTGGGTFVKTQNATTDTKEVCGKSDSQLNKTVETYEADAYICR